MAAEVSRTMPTPNTTLAALAASLGHIDPRSEAAVDEFYSEVFPSYSEEARTLIFSWLSATDVEASPADIAAFVQFVEPTLLKEAIPAEEANPEESDAPSMW